jgi:hypothetical protein
MPAYFDEKHLSKDIRQYNDERVKCRWSGTGGLEIFFEGLEIFSRDKICRARRFRVLVSCKT